MFLPAAALDEFIHHQMFDQLTQEGFTIFPFVVISRVYNLNIYACYIQ